MRNDLTPPETALALLRRSRWPVPIKPRSKAPIGDDWGVERPTEESLRATYAAHPAAGVGIRLGPESGVIDMEVDGPEGEASLRKLLGGDVDTLGWDSRRGPHHLLRYDPRLAKYGKTIIKVPELPGLEIRIGGDGKQLQSCCPPTIGDDGQPRRWNDCDVIAELPESVFVYLDAYTSRPTRVVSEPAAPPQRVSRFVATASNGTGPEDRARAYVFASGFPESIAGQGGHGVLYRVACELVDGFGLSESQALPILTDWNAQKARPPESDKQVRHKLDDAIKNNPTPSLKRLNAPRPGPTTRQAAPTPEQDWPPLRFEEPPPLLPFPAEVFPTPLQAYCREVAAAKLAPVDFVGAAMLVVAGAAIGQSMNIVVKRDWTEAPLLYLVLVAPPGKTKTPVIRAVVKPAVIDRRLREDSAKAREEWIERKKAHDKDDDAAPPGPEPPQLRAIVKDVTRESLVIILADNARGVLCDPDEASGWVASFNEYKGKGGSDRQFWLSIWSCTAVSVDRKGGRESIYVPFPFASMLGGLPPDMLSSLMDERGRNDGLLDRILSTYPEEFPRQRWTEVELSEEAERDWAQAIGKLFDMPMQVKDDIECPYLVDFTPEGKRLWVKWFDAHADEMEGPEFSDRHAGAWSKMRAHAARFALILYRLRWACSPPSSLDVPPSPWSMTVGGGSVDVADVEGAIKLADYFKSQLVRTAHQTTGGLGSADAKQIVDWIRRKNLTTFREADVGADLRSFREKSKALAAALAILVESGAIRPRTETRDASKRGPKATDAYDVHPELLGAPEITGNTANSSPAAPDQSNSGNPGNSWRCHENGTAPDREVFEL